MESGSNVVNIGQHTGDDAAAKIQREVVADLVGDYLFTDKAFVQKLSTENRNVFQKIFDEIKYLCKVVTAGSKEAKQLEKVKKIFEEAYRAETKNPTGEGGVKYALTEYSEQQKKNWASSKRIVIYDSPQHLNEFIQNAVTDKTMDKKMYFGAIPSDLAARIEADAGINVENFNLSLGAYEIRKILKDHGNEATEAPRGQRAVVEDDFAHIVDVVLNPQSVSRSPDTYMGKPAIVFTGDHNGRMNVVAVVSDKRLDLFVQTVYVNIKKGNLATPIGEQAPINTPEANSGTVSEDNVAQNLENVKYSLSAETDKSYLDAVNRGDTATAQKLVDQAAADAGYTIKAYHGTDAEAFNEFDRGKIGEATGVSILGDGFYFADNKEAAQQYGKNVYTVYLRQAAPYSATADDAYRLKAVDLEKQGHDSVVLRTGKGQVYMVLDPNQIKSAEAVTYDDKGKVIPLSERFNPEKTDIRYSLSEEAQTDDIAPLPWQVRGQDVALGIRAPIGENVVTKQNAAPEGELVDLLDQETVEGKLS